ncbi:hypothetical protein [Flavobacterium ovatum]|uniref:hypothetical protein n=1 Tax=Flavobacterium ovatum TaxID=1928857 RepID=UPI00344BD560
MNKKNKRGDYLLSALLVAFFYLLCGKAQTFAAPANCLSKEVFLFSNSNFHNNKAIFETVYSDPGIDNDFFDDVEVEFKSQLFCSYSKKVNFSFLEKENKSFYTTVSLLNKGKIPLYLLFCNWKIDVQ